MRHVYQNIQNNTKQLAVLIDPDKFLVENTVGFIEKVNQSIATHIFVGGSIVDLDVTDILVEEIKKHTQLPIVLFPGDVTQITEKADAILFLSLISGRNPEYLIGKHVEAVSKLRNTTLEVISTGYILIESGKETAVQQVTETLPLERSNIQKIVDTAKAAQLLGMKLIYLEAGSGARFPVLGTVISKVKQETELPLIVGGGIRNLDQLENAYASGADLVVIGTAFEEDELFFEALKK
ncbi:phosphoglycerol geranylgeranyltransferase [Algibacter lectus]|uniref:Geranylgeranylglyceryl phosphate synthase n=1 Tax=Algibacter lectus TaxID=221126 RepID=A0A4R8MAJ6_9FLAO|nr:geranylgeranylglyceryl/heptaprenylglyceryl phosphate synthase [Algibacter lectus]MWW24653.1 geranylgeranylglyceryl/heptaprenylglyceryl phosphate synthase [Algibacter lectus]TDY62673.1 putative glycerol-1-phosphate prenyltransferase [Algibacter lectus]